MMFRQKGFDCYTKPSAHCPVIRRDRSARVHRFQSPTSAENRRGRRHGLAGRPTLAQEAKAENGNRAENIIECHCILDLGLKLITYRNHRFSAMWLHWGAGIAAVAAVLYLCVGWVVAAGGELDIAVVAGRHVGWPLLAALTAMLVWAMTSPRPIGRIGRRLRRIGLRFTILWRRAGWVRRLVIAALIAHLLIGLGYWLEVPWTLRNANDELRQASVSPVRKFRGRWAANYPFWTRKVIAETPPEARILYRGGWEGMVFSYDVFPRRVFALPGDLQTLAGKWHKHVWLEMKTNGRSNADADTDRFWTAVSRFEPIPYEEFVRRYAIDYVVVFDENRPSECAIFPLQENRPEDRLSRIPQPEHDGASLSKR